jgi:GMP synthase-like glutamine amidotransferase
MRRLLYLDNAPNPTPAARVDGLFAEAGFVVDVRLAAYGDFPTRIQDYAGAFLSGSPHGAYDDVPWIHREHEVIQELARAEVPTLGVCFGAQILASALCGRDQVFRRPSCEVGYKWLNVARGGDDALTGGLGERLYMFVWHNDEVRADHPDMVILAATDACPNQIWRYRTAAIWGVQGHPELDKARAQALFTRNRARLEQDGADVDRLLAQADETAEAKQLLANFMQVCLGHHRGAGR